MGKWDILVAEAYEIVQRERCGECRLPLWICHNEDNAVQFRVSVKSCVAMAEVDKKRASMTKGKKEMPAGTNLQPEPYMVDDSRQLIELREAYYKAEYEKAHPEIAPA